MNAFIQFWKNYFGRIRQARQTYQQTHFILEDNRTVTKAGVYRVEIKKKPYSFFSRKEQPLQVLQFQIDRTSHGWQINLRDKDAQNNARYLLEKDANGNWLFKGKKQCERSNLAVTLSKAAPHYPSHYTCRGEKPGAFWLFNKQEVHFSIAGTQGFYQIQQTGHSSEGTNMLSVRPLKVARTEQGWHMTLGDTNDFDCSVHVNGDDLESDIEGPPLLMVLALIEARHSSG